MFQTVVLSLTLGVFVTILAKKLKTSAIALLLIVGIVSGPEVLSIIDPKILGIGLETLVSLAVAIILFEGGLTLDYSGYRQTSGVIRRLLSLGVLVTWGLTAYFSHLFFKTDLSHSLLIGSLVIVTGPTVITPLLRRVNVNNRVYQILHWEGVLNDPIGVFISITCFEVVLSQGAATGAVYNLFLRFATGMISGLLIGYLSYLMLKKKWIPEDHINIFVFAIAIVSFGVAELIVHESGLLAVVVAGFILGIKKPTSLTSVKKFKLELTEILIGLIFILLSANLDLNKINLFGQQGLFLILCLLFLVRPVMVFLCTVGEGIPWNEKLFLSWISPRGIVAASMATLFGLKLEANGNQYAWLVETFTFCVIGSTVILQGFSAGLVAKILKVKKEKAKDFLIIGANELAVKFANWVELHTDSKTLIVDSNAKSIHTLPVTNKLVRNAMEVDVILDQGVVDIGNVVCITDNAELNALLADKWSAVPGVHEVYRWASLSDHLKNHQGTEIWKFLPKPGLVSLEIIRGETQLIHENEFNKREDIRFLCGQMDRETIFKNENNLTKSTMKKSLFIRRNQLSLEQFLRANHVFMLEDLTQKKFYEKVAEKITEQYAHLPKDRIAHELFERENQQSTAVGEGIAIPHIYLTDLKSPICILVQVKEGLNWLTPDQKPIKLLFILLSPSGDSERHLSILAQITHLISEPKTKKDLMSATDAENVVQIMHERFQKLSP